MRVELVTADRAEPVCMEARSIPDFAAGLPVVDYRHASMAGDEIRPTVLCFSGGGCSGAVFALLAEKCAQRGIRAVSFDMPGHTPRHLLGAATPPRALVSRANGKVRQLFSESMIARWASYASPVDVLSHSAGIVDIARVARQQPRRIRRFFITAAGIPGPRAMWIALRATTFGKSAEPMTLTSMITRRQIPTGHLSDHYGPESQRAVSDADLRNYHCAEHISVPRTLLRSRPVERQDWRGRTVVLVGSAGDPISPPERISSAAQRLRARGARVEIEILHGELPHMFLSFERAADRLAQLCTR